MAIGIDEFNLQLNGELDKPQSESNINKDIEDLEKKIEHLKIQAEIDPSVIAKLEKQLENLMNKKLSISNISVDNGSVSKVEKQIEDSIVKGTKTGVNKAKTELKSFSDLKNFSELNKSIEHIQIDPSDLKNYNNILDDVKRKYAEFGQVKITDEVFKDGALEKFRVNIEQVNGDLKETKSFLMSLNDTKDTYLFNGVIKGSESIVQHLDKAKNAVNQTADAVNALKDSTKLGKIQDLIDDKSYEAEIARITNGFKNLSGDITKAKEQVKSLQSAYEKMVNATNDKSRLKAEKLYQSELSKTKNMLTIAQMEAKEYIDSFKVAKLRNDIQDWLKKNTNATIEAKTAMESYLSMLNGKMVSPIDYNFIRGELDNWDTQMRKSDRLGKSSIQTFKEGMRSFSEWTFSSGTVMELITAVKSVFNASIELNDVITDFAMATGKSDEQIQSLTNSYSDLGKELNATITDVMDSATEWIKQGQSIADTETLITNAMILSKVGKLSSADATKYLTSAMKGYKVAAEDTLNVVDKMSAVDMASATDVGGLAEGMSQVAASADLAGVSMDKLLGYLATIGEVTQSGMSEVGTMLNAVFSRMGNIKLARLKDYETGEDLSNVETVLRGVQLSLRDTDDSFREFDEVLDETASRWSTFSETQQRAMASAFAGTHHMNEFIILMENYGKALEYTEVSLNSSGEAMKKFEEYQKSIKAHTELFTRAVQDLADTLVDSGLINFFIDFGTTSIEIIDGIMEAITPLGSMATIIGGVLGANGLGLTELCYN